MQRNVRREVGGGGGHVTQLLIRCDVQVFLCRKTTAQTKNKSERADVFADPLHGGVQPKVSGVEVPLQADGGVIFLDWA